jgi:hypothetical protein
MNEYGMRDEQWERIKGMLPGRPGMVGVNAKNNRLFVEAVRYRTPGWGSRGGRYRSTLGPLKQYIRGTRAGKPAGGLAGDVRASGREGESDVGDARFDCGPSQSAQRRIKKGSRPQIF